MDAEKLRQSSQFRLISLITSIAASSTPKDLAIHEDLMKPLDQVAGARVLRENGVEKMFKLTESAPQWKSNIRIYLIPAIYSVAESVAHHLQRERGKRLEYHVIVVPQCLSLLQSLFESLGIVDVATFHSYSWDFIPLDHSLLSLEIPQFFRASFLKGDNSLLSSIAKALLSFECLYGKFLCVATLGERAQKVHTLLETWRSEICPSCPPESEFSHLIIVDRSTDFASLLLTQLTYEGVLDENFGIKSGFVYLNSNEEDGAQQRLMVNSTKDEIFAEVKGKHISAVFQHLSGKAKELQTLQSRKNTDSIEEMKQFVAHDLKKIQSQQKSLSLHISACESVMSRQAGVLEELLDLQQNVMADTASKEYLTFLEDSMARRFDFHTTLRLACLYSLMQDGFSEKDFKMFQKHLVQAYGYRHLSSLHNLQVLSLFNQRDSRLNLDLLPDKLLSRSASLKSEKMPFRKICQRLNLLPLDAITGNAPDKIKSGAHPSYVFGGVYTPLVYPFVEKCLRDKEPSLEDFARCFGNILCTNSFNNPHWSSAKGRVLVCLLGGVTMAECAALDLLTRQIGRHIVVASTSTISASAFLRSVTSQHFDT